jgi:hypothetical protein
VARGRGRSAEGFTDTLALVVTLQLPAVRHCVLDGDEYLYHLPPRLKSKAKMWLGTQKRAKGELNLKMCFDLSYYYNEQRL